jgi:hypothetical protein
MCSKWLVTAVLLATLWAGGCDSSGKWIVIVLPDGYRGEFRIVKDSEVGKDLVERDGKWVFEIPADGTLRVKDHSPFYQWHKMDYRFRDGTRAIVEDLGTRPAQRETPSGFAWSTDWDGTTHTWRVVR